MINLNKNEIKMIKLYEKIFDLYNLKNIRILENIDLDSLSIIIKSFETNKKHKARIFEEINTIKMMRKTVQILREIDEILYYHKYIKLSLTEDIDLYPKDFKHFLSSNNIVYKEC